MPDGHNNYIINREENIRSRTKCTGNIYFPTANVHYHVEVLPDRDGQTRKFMINGNNFELCNKDNLSFAGYHQFVYEDFVKGNGIPLSETRKSIELVLKL